MTTITDLENIKTITDSLEFAIDSTDQTFSMSVGQLRDYLSGTFSTIDYANSLELTAGLVIAAPVTSYKGFLLCNGANVSRTTYSKLFAAIGTNFGAGDGGTTFTLPDYRGKFLRGYGGDSGTLYATQNEGLPNITGSVTGMAGYWNNTGTASGAFSIGGKNGEIGSDGKAISKYQVSFEAKKSNSIYGASSHVTPINQAINFFIKY